MSLFSGCYDLYNYMMSEKTYEFDSFRKSDELECFNIFKERTGGVIHQHQEIEVTGYNQDYVEKHCPEFKVIPHKTAVKDGRLKTKQKEITTYTYEYYGKEYKTLKELNKHKVYITIDIHFNTLLDIIPYYPHSIKFATSSEDKEVIYISKESQILSEKNSFYKWGGGSAWEYFTKRLQEHYLEVCQKYFLYKIEERTKIIPIAGYEEYDDSHFKLTIENGIDYMHSLYYVWDDNKPHTHWTCPEMLDEHTILLHNEDIKGLLADDIKSGIVKIKYVEKCDFPKDYK